MRQQVVISSNFDGMQAKALGLHFRPVRSGRASRDDLASLALKEANERLQEMPGGEVNGAKLKDARSIHFARL